MGPFRRFHEPLPPVEEHSDEDCNDCDHSEGSATAEWSLTSSLLNSTSSSSSSSVLEDEEKARRQREQMKDLLCLGSSSKVSATFVATQPPLERKEKPPSAFSSSSPIRSNTLMHSTEYSKYFKMLAAGVPLDWVVKVCEVDQKDSSMLYLDPHLPLESETTKKYEPISDCEVSEESYDANSDTNAGDEEPMLEPCAANSDTNIGDEESMLEPCAAGGDTNIGDEESMDAADTAEAISLVENAVECDGEGESKEEACGEDYEDCNSSSGETEPPKAPKPVTNGESNNNHEMDEGMETGVARIDTVTDNDVNNDDSQHELEEAFHDAQSSPAALAQETMLRDFNDTTRDVKFVNHVPQDVIFRDFSGPASLEESSKDINESNAVDDAQSDDEDDDGGGFFGFLGFGKKSKPKKPREKAEATGQQEQSQQQNAGDSESVGKSSVSADPNEAKAAATAEDERLTKRPTEETDMEPEFSTNDVGELHAEESSEADTGTQTAPDPVNEESPAASASPPLDNDTEVESTPEQSAAEDAIDEEDGQSTSDALVDQASAVETEMGKNAAVESTPEQSATEGAIDEGNDQSTSDALLDQASAVETKKFVEDQEDALPLGKDPAYAKYFLMLKVGVPIDRVKLIFELDGKDPAILELDPEKSYACQADTEKKLHRNVDDVSDRKEGNEVPSLPPVTTTERDTSMDRRSSSDDEGSDVPRNVESEETPPPQKQVVAKNETENNRQDQRKREPDLPLCKDPAYARYFLMLKARVPVDRVRNVIELDGKDPSIVDLDPNRSYASQVGAGGDDEVSPSPEMGSGGKDEDLKPLMPGDTMAATDIDQDSKTATTAGLETSLRLPVTTQLQGKRIGRFENGTPLQLSSTEMQVKRSAHLHPSSLRNAKLLQQPRASMEGNESATGTLSHDARANLDALFVRRAIALTQLPSVASHKDTDADTPQKPPEGARVALKDDPEYTKYFKMLQMKMPREVVEHALQRDGKDPSILDLDPDKDLKSQQESKDNSVSNTDNPPLKEDPEYAKYFKMLQMKMPENVVRHALHRDGKDPGILELDPGKSLKSQKKQDCNKGNDDEPPLNKDPEYLKYFKMLQAGLPENVVRHALQRDGKDPGILDLDPDKSLISQKDAGAKTSENQRKGVSNLTKRTKDVVTDKGEHTKSQKEKVVRKRLFWNSIDKSNLHGSLWADAQSEKTLDLSGLEYDEEEFASLFTSTGTDKNPTDKAKEGLTKNPKSSVQLIDSRRQMNGSILLAKYKHDYKVLAQKLDRLDSDEMDETELLALMQLLPTKDESLAIRSYLPPPESPQSAKEDALSKLGECEMYMAAMLDVKNSKNKFECLLYKAQFNGLVSDLASEISALKEALVCVRKSDKLARLMVFALRLGNTLNTGTSGKEVAAITLDSLLKLHEAKAFDKKTSVLHYLVSIIHNNDKEVLKVSDDLLPALKAERIDADALKKSLVDLRKGHDRLKAMAEQIAGETDEGESTNSMERFVQDAAAELQRLSGELDASHVLFADLLRYFGEKQDMKVHDFFSTLTRFIAMFESARADVKRMQATKARRERMAKAHKSKSTGSISTGSNFAKERSAVLHEIVRVSSEKQMKTVEEEEN